MQVCSCLWPVLMWSMLQWLVLVLWPMGLLQLVLHPPHCPSTRLHSVACQTNNTWVQTLHFLDGHLSTSSSVLANSTDRSSLPDSPTLDCSGGEFSGFEDSCLCHVVN